MRPESLELELKSRTPVSQSVLQKLKTNSLNVSGTGANEAEFLGGVIRNGQLAWFAIGSNVEVFSLKTGQRVAGHSFDEKSVVTCVAEVTAIDINSCLLIIAVQRSPVGGLLYLFSVQGSRIVHRIDVIDKITSCCFICEEVCKRGNLAAFDGCAAVGTDGGEVFLVDLNLNRCKEIISRQKPFNQGDDSSCKILSAPIDLEEIQCHVKQTRAENINLGIRLDVSVIEQPSAVSSILSMPQMQMIVVGLESGILALFNLSDLNALHLAYPPEIESPLVKLTFLEPADDPRPCVYIWAFHANKSNFPYAVMHAVTFNSKTYQDGENIYETFQWCRPDLTIPIYEKNSTPISCQSVTKIVTEEEDEQYSLCLLAWTNRTSSFVLVFDLNQWYKEQMPRVCDWRDYPSYLAPFPIEIGDEPLDIWLNSKSVVTFNSIQRPEEHFYPTSLSFDLIELTSSAIHRLHWAGLQNNAIKRLSSTGAVAILVPDECFIEFLEASLIPQLSDQNYHANPSKKMKQEFLLSMALEYNCMGLLRECAQRWADGSHMGRGANSGLTLSTLTEWIWNQATLIKDRCNDLCISLFDDSGITIDLRSRKILAHYSRQLKLLADLLHLIISNYRQYIPDEIFDTLTAQRNSIRMTSEYQEVLQWLLNMGLLPEIVWNQSTLPEPKNDTFTATPYPYRILNEFYTEQRQRFYDFDRNNIVPKTNSCKCLYIDSFIDRECNSHLLRTEWSNGLGDGLYPPPSLQAMLRILLIPGISLENKYMLFVYLFLDLHFFLEGEHFDVVQNLIKFPAVFKLNSSLIKTTQAFWNLDHNEYEVALRELISPLTSDRFITQWQQELLVNTLLIRDMPHLALQAIRSPGPSISTSLRVKTLLSNNLITEAFELQRSKFDEKLLMEFFKGCHEHKKWNYVLGLSLTEHEGEILCKFLRTCESLLSENLHLLYLLQRNKYIDALTYLDETKHKHRSPSMHRKLENTQDLIMSSYKLAMNSASRELCDQYMTIKNRLSVDVQQGCDAPKPLSSELNPFIVDTNANVVGSVFHRAIISAKRTGFNTAFKNHIPLLGSIRIDLDLDDAEEYKAIVEPKPYVGVVKRRKEISYENNADPDTKQPAAKRQRVDSFSIGDVPMKKHAPGINSYLLSSLTNHNQIAQKLQNRDDIDETMEMGKGQRNSLGELCDTVNLLSTPVVKSSRLEKHNRIESRCQTPQSILKQRHTEMGSIISRRSTSPSLTVNSARRSVDFNAKSFCYTIPPQNDEFRLGAIQETINLQEDDDSNSANSPNSIKGRRAIHSSKSSSASNSVDEFYSPETSKVQEESELQETDNNDLSRISRHEDATTPTTSQVKPRRKLRSNTPEPPMMSSTRITRSRSKLNLDDTADYENTTQQKVLNTSTPKRTTPKRSPARSLSKSVITSNALKVQTEHSVSSKSDTQFERESEENESIDMATESKHRNFLKDASELSLRQRSLQAYSTDEIDMTQQKQNLLQDSSSFASDFSAGNDESLPAPADSSMETKIVEEKASERASDETTQEVVEKEIEENIEENSQDQTDEPMSFEDEKSQQIIDTERENCFAQDSSIDEQNMETVTISPKPGECIENPESTTVITETITEETTITITQKLPQNYLTDSSMAGNDSIMQKFNRYENFTSTFFSETPRTQNLLEDSSICAPFTGQETVELKSNADSEKDIVNIDDDESKSNSTSNNTISSDSDSEIDGDLIYEASDNEEEAAHEEEDNDEVIEIGSTSSEGENGSQAKSIDDFGVIDSQDNYNVYDDLKYGEEFATTSQPSASQFEHVDEYQITELQTAPIQHDIPPTDLGAQSIIGAQEQAMNELIYGDLDGADTEMLDLDVHKDAFGFEMHGHGHQAEQNQGGIYLDEEISSTSNQQLIVDEQSCVAQTQQSHSNEELISKEECVEPINIADNTEAIEDNTGGENKMNESVNANTEITDTNNEAQEQSEIIIAPNPTEPTINETNILDKAVIIDETSVVASSADANQIQFETVSDDPMEVTEMETTNVFEKAAVSSMLDVDQSVKLVSGDATKLSEDTIEPEVTTKADKIKEIEGKKSEMEDIVDAKQVESNVEASDHEKLVEQESGSKRPKSPSRRVRRVTSKQDLTKEAETVEIDESEKEIQVELSEAEIKLKPKSKKVSSKKLKLDDVEFESNEAKPKSRSARAKSQQPTNEQEVEKLNRKRRGVSETRDFKLLLSRHEVEQALATEKETSASTTQQADEPVRKKRGASQQKEQPIKVTAEDEPRTSKASGEKRQRTKSITETGLGDKFDAEESATNRRLRKATSHASLSEAIESADQVSTPKKGRSPSRTKTEKGTPRRAASHQSLSSISDSGSQPSEEVARRPTRAKSILSVDKEAPATPRTRRTASQLRLNETDEKEVVKTQKRKKSKSESNDSDSELGDRFDADESAPNRRLRKAVSHQTLSKIVESPTEKTPSKKGKSQAKKEPTTPRTRRSASQQSLSSVTDSNVGDNNEIETVAKKTPSRKRTKSETSEKGKDETESTPTRTRTRRTPSESKQSPDNQDKKEPRKTSKRSNKKDDDSHSETSSIVSNRSRKTATNNDDDTSSVKSSRVRATRSASVLPAIPEDEIQATNVLPQEYLETSRLTRSQRATIEKYAKPKEKVSDAETNIRRSSRKIKTQDDEPGSDHSDTESVISQKSTASKASKKSKTSEASSSQRTTRQRSQKK